MRFVNVISIIIAVFISQILSMAYAANESPQTFTLDGQLYASDHTSPLLDSAVKLKVQILDPSKNCILYEEEQSVDTTTSGGHFTIQVGSVVGATKRKSMDAGNTMQKIYQNSSSIPAAGGSCSGLYSPVLGAIRYVRMIVTPTAGAPTALSPDMVMDAVPNAMVAQSVQGLEREDIIQSNPVANVTQSRLEQFFTSLVAGGTGSSIRYDGTNFVAYNPSNGAILSPGTVADSAIGSVGWAKITSVPPVLSTIASLTCTNGQILKLVSGSWACAAESGVGSESDPTVAAYAKNAPGMGLTVSGGAIVADFGTGAGKVVQGNDSRLSDSRAPNGGASGDLSGTYPSPTVAKIQGRGVSVTAPVDGQVLRYNIGSLVWEPYNFGIGDLKTNAGTPQFISASCTASQTLIWSSVTNTFSCTTIGIGGSQVTGNIAGNAANVTGTVAIANGGTGQTTAAAALEALLPSQSGQNGKVLQSNGTTASWQTPAASGITSLNGSSQSLQTFATPGVSGTAPDWSTSTGTGVHTLNIPMASTAGVTAGLISKTEYDNFNSKLSAETDPKVGANTTNYLSKWNGSALVASAVIESGGLVGIGSTSPTTDVDIRNNQNGASGVRVFNNSASASSKGRLVFDNGTSSGGFGHNGTGFTSAGGYQPNSSYVDGTGANGVSFMASNAAGVVRVYTGGSANANERLRIDSSGNVAIGTTTATAKLDVNGTINATAMTINGVPVGTSTGMTSLNGSSQVTQTFAVPGITGTAPDWSTNAGTGVHTLNIPMASASSVTAGLISKADYDNFNSKLGTGSSLSGDVTGTPVATVVDRIKGKSVSAAPTAAGQVLRYDGTNITPNFLSMFDLRSTVTGTQAFGGAGCLSNQTLTWTAATDNLACTNISLPAVQITGLSAVESDPKVGVNTTNYLSKWNGLALVASGVIENSGNVGIGTSNPLTRLHVGKVAGVATSSVGDHVNGTTDNQNGINQTIYSDGNNYIDYKTFTGGYSHFRTGEGTESGAQRVWMSVQASSGNIGIGSMSPTSKLEVAGVIHTTTGGIKFPDGTVQTTSAVSGTNNTMITNWPDAVICTGSDAIARIFYFAAPNASGYYVYLHDSNNLKYNSAGTYSSSSNAAYTTSCQSQTIAQTYAAGKAFNFVKGPVGQWLEASGNAYRDTGNVGIGTTSPASKLEVAGIIHSSSGGVKFPDGSIQTTANAASLQILIVVDQKPNNTDAGTFTAGSWTTRVLNTVQANTISGASLSANQITLPAGTYLIEARAPAYRVDYHQTRLRNITDASDALYGSGAYADNAVQTSNDSFITGQITISGTKVFELQHISTATKTSNGLGLGGGNFGIPVQFAVVKITKLN